MAILSIKCPHCDTPKSPLQAVIFVQRKQQASLATAAFICPICDKPVGAWISQTRHVSNAMIVAELHNWPKTLDDGGWEASEIWPHAEASTAPSDVPDLIARNFIQAEEAAKREHRETAGMGYRRTLELALKDKSPNTNGMLAARIKTLASAGTLTPDIATWANSIRDLGNEAAHDFDEPSKEDIADLAAFTRVVLEYLYTMPAKVVRRAIPIVP
jgi:hypothetical protein